ncbi:MAG: 2-hydroxyacyl-CoA dehydratase family protein [Pseudomonadota bacterium]
MMTISERLLHPDDATRDAALEAAKASGKPVVGLIGAVVPVELVLAAGCVPITLTARAADWERDAAPMEQGHEPEMRSLFLQAVEGQFEACDLLVIPSTSDGLRFLYQYLKEMVRQGRGERVPPLYTYDFLFGRSDPVRGYSRRVQDSLVRRLAVLSGRAAAPEALLQAIAAGGAVREQWRRLNRLRAQGRVGGCDAHGAMRAGAFLQPDVYAQRLEAWNDELSALPQDDTRPRLLLAPAVPLYHEHLHALAEQAGALVTCEDDEWGARRGDAGIAGDAAPADAIFSYCYDYACSQRMLRAQREAWLEAAMRQGEVEGVVFYIPPSDQAYGWRYPDLKSMAEAYGLPTLLVRDDVLDPAAAPAIAAQLAAFCEALVRQPSTSSTGGRQ